MSDNQSQFVIEFVIKNKDRPPVLKILAVGVALLVGSIMVIVAVGYALPQLHVAARAISLNRQPQEVFALISDFKMNRHGAVTSSRLTFCPMRTDTYAFAKRASMGR